MSLLLVALGLCAIASLLGALLPAPARVTSSSVLVLAASCCAAASSVSALRGAHVTSVHSTALLPLTGMTMTLDPLGAVFVAITAMVAAAVSIYNLGYVTGALGSRSASCLLPVFVLSLLAVPVAASVATLMFFWELMAMSSMLLIAVEHRHRAEARDATLWYGTMTQLGAGSILLGLLVLTIHGGGQSFASIAAHAGALPRVARSTAFLLVLLGFASKAGAVPLHAWLPKAHPEAPTPVSALMSGAMVATGVYGILRVGGDLLGGGTLWWWVAVAAIGVVSALFGALHATASSDLKGLLAYSTIDVVGLVLVGVGAAGALSVTGRRGAAELTMVAALLLLVAHAAFKGALFLGAGAVDRAAGTRDLNLLGGLARRLPVTSGLFALATLTIVAVPTLAGFSGEWLLLQGLLHGFGGTSTPTLITLLIGVVALALSGGLTAVAFVKAFGIGFLGQARSAGASRAVEVPRAMQLATGLLCVPCVLLGVAPGLIVPWLSRAANEGLHLRARRPVAEGTSLVLSRFQGAFEPLLVLAALAAALAAIWIVTSLAARRGPRRVAAWGCGREAQTPRMQYTATSFGEPLQRVFVDVLRPDVDLEVTHETESKYYEQALAYENRVEDAVERSVYRPVIAGFRRYGDAVRGLQNGSIHRYLAFGFIALLVVLVVLA